MISDTYNTTYGVSHNNPLWEETKTSAEGVLTFNGISQYVTVNRNLSYFKDMEIQTSVLWRGGSANQNIFYFGDDSSYMYLTPSNNDGVAELVIAKYGNVQSLTSNIPLPKGEWAVVRIILSGDSGKLIIDMGPEGAEITEGVITLNPEDISGAYDGNGVFSIARGFDGNYFKGSMDYFNVFFKEVSAPDYYYTEKEILSGEEIVVILGDVNEDKSVNIFDTIVFKSHLIGSDELESNYALAAADIDQDGVISISDMILLQKYLFGAIDSFPNDSTVTIISDTK